MTEGTAEKRKSPTIEELEAQGRVPWKVAKDFETPFVPNPVSLFARVREFFQSHLYHPDPRAFTVLAAWVLHTWHYHRFRTSPPLLLAGPISSGKTTVLECMEEIAYRGTRGGSMTPSSMFRLSEWAGPTLLVDESQLYNREEQAEAQAFLNERYRVSGKVTRVERDDSGFHVQFFNAYGPTVLAGSETAWEAMVSRGITIIMEKGRPEYRTLTDSFFGKGERLRMELKLYSRTFNPVDPHLSGHVDYAGYVDYSQFPRADLSKFEGRIEEKIEPLILCTPLEYREELLSCAMDMARRQKAQEDTGFMAEIFQAYLLCESDNGKVSLRAVRTQLAMIRGCMRIVRTDGVATQEADLNARDMPHSKTVMRSLETLGFERTRMRDGSRGVLTNAELEKRLRRRYTMDSPSVPSVSSGNEREDMMAPDGTDATGARHELPAQTSAAEMQSELTHQEVSDLALTVLDCLKRDSRPYLTAAQIAYSVQVRTSTVAQLLEKMDRNGLVQQLRTDCWSLTK